MAQPLLLRRHDGCSTRCCKRSTAGCRCCRADEENGLLGLFKKPKYIFLFIGDGMGTAQIQSARFYKGTVDNNGAVTEADLSFTGFPTVGSVTTYDSTSFCPDSASTATSIATGHKTESGVINMCPWTRDVPYETIAEKLHAQKGYKVGVISSVNIDHATPAAFYAHQKTRKNYYRDRRGAGKLRL
ncbi:MAG: alkaline phosphatase [Faecalibacterium sp.]